MRPTPEAARTRSRALGVALFGAAALLVAVRTVLPVQDDMTTSFAGYWVVAREWLAGTPVVDLYDDAVLAERMVAHGTGLRERMLGPPSLVLTLAPLADLPYVLSRRIWLWAVCLPALLVGTWLAARRLGPVAGPLLAAAFVVSPGAALGLEVGQVYSVILLLHVLAFRAARPALFGAAIAPMIVSRGWTGAPLVVAEVVGGRLRSAGAAVMGAVVLGLLTVPLVGADAWWHFLTVQLPAPVDPAHAGVPAYQSLPSVLAHLTTTHPDWGPDPPLPFPALVPWLMLAGVGAVGAILVRVRHDRDRALAVAVCATLLLSPFTQDYQLVLAILPAAVAWERGHRGLCLLGVALVVAPFDWSGVWGGWRSLLAYPRVWGVSCLLLALVARRPPR